jgi:hypothetical protein
MGVVHRKRGEVLDANLWLTRYRDTCVALSKLDSSLPAWRSALASGYLTLAELDWESGKIDPAHRGFTEALGVLTKLLDESPDDHVLQSQIAETNSRLGRVAVQRANHEEAAAGSPNQLLPAKR